MESYLFNNDSTCMNFNKWIESILKLWYIKKLWYQIKIGLGKLPIFTMLFEWFKLRDINLLKK